MQKRPQHAPIRRQAVARGISFRGALRQDPSTAGASQQKRLIGSFAEGAPGESGTFRQAVLHRCACGCRFRWPELAERVEVREAGALEVVELAACPACHTTGLAPL